MSLTFEMHNPVGQIMKELTDPAMRGVTQDSVALTYAYIMAQEPNADWPAINAAIRARWPSKSSLVRVKTLAWAQLARWQEGRTA